MPNTGSPLGSTRAQSSPRTPAVSLSSISCRWAGSLPLLAAEPLLHPPVCPPETGLSLSFPSICWPSVLISWVFLCVGSSRLLSSWAIWDCAYGILGLATAIRRFIRHRASHCSCLVSALRVAAFTLLLLILFFQINTNVGKTGQTLCKSYN
jgi:hypothetical protein